jgi:ribosome-binding protein aMBF1 (putative translation factor)
MNHEEYRKFAEANGWKYYEHAGDAVGMNEAEKQEMDFRNELSSAIRNRREKLKISEKEFAARIKVSRKKLNRLEMGMPEIPIEQMLSAYSALGGRIGITELPPYSSNGEQNGAKPTKRKARATA